MTKAKRKGSLLLILAAICAASLLASPAFVAAEETNWTEDSPGGSGTNTGDPDQPEPDKPLMSPRTSLYSVSPRSTLQTDSRTVFGVSSRGWMQALVWALRTRLGW